MPLLLLFCCTTAKAKPQHLCIFLLLLLLHSGPVELLHSALSLTDSLLINLQLFCLSASIVSFSAYFCPSMQWLNQKLRLQDKQWAVSLLPLIPFFSLRWLTGRSKLGDPSDVCSLADAELLYFYSILDCLDPISVYAGELSALSTDL